MYPLVIAIHEAIAANPNGTNPMFSEKHCIEVGRTYGSSFCCSYLVLPHRQSHIDENSGMRCLIGQGLHNLGYSDGFLTSLEQSCGPFSSLHSEERTLSADAPLEYRQQFHDLRDQLREYPQHVLKWIGYMQNAADDGTPWGECMQWTQAHMRDLYGGSSTYDRVMADVAPPSPPVTQDDRPTDLAE